MSNDNRLNQIERTLLELGTEIFRVKTELSSLKNTNETFLEVMKGLKGLLDEKGVISCDDFENAIDLGQAILSTTSPTDSVLGDEISKIKKTSH